MGWCGGTEIFDEVVGFALTAMPTATRHEVRGLVKALIMVLEQHDADNLCESEYYDNSLVKQAFKEVNQL